MTVKEIDQALTEIMKTAGKDIRMKTPVNPNEKLGYVLSQGRENLLIEFAAGFLPGDE